MQQREIRFSRMPYQAKTRTQIYIKRTAFQRAQNAMIATTNINVPRYDYDSDSFVYDDGKVISNTDPIFKEYKWFWIWYIQ